MTSMTFENKFTIGNLVTIVLAVGGGILVWGTTVSQVQQSASEIVSLKNDIVQIKRDAADLLASINQDRQEQAKLLTELAVDVRYLRRSVEEFKRTGLADEMALR